MCTYHANQNRPTGRHTAPNMGEYRRLRIVGVETLGAIGGLWAYASGGARPVGLFRIAAQ